LGPKAPIYLPTTDRKPPLYFDHRTARLKRPPTIHLDSSGRFPEDTIDCQFPTQPIYTQQLNHYCNHNLKIRWPSPPTRITNRHRIRRPTREKLNSAGKMSWQGEHPPQHAQDPYIRADMDFQHTWIRGWQSLRSRCPFRQC
jgi:hypothetical protein